MKEAEFWHKEQNQSVRCDLCPHHCLIMDGKHGLCRVRVNRNGVLYSGEYGKVVSFAVDPIEKKPLYHFYPGSDILSVGVNGCNLMCKFCQNWQISQEKTATRYVSPQDMINLAKKYNSFAIAYTYTEPTIWYEYIMDCFVLAHENGIKNVLVTNGYLNKEPLMRLAPLTDAMNIDLKSMDDEFYRNICGGSLEPVLEFIEYSAKITHIELTNLIIPTLNDSDELLNKLVSWVASVNPEIPIHFSAYYPQYKMKIPPTSAETLERAYKIASKHLKYVYIGNLMTDYGSNTYCPKCNNLLIKRNGYKIDTTGLFADRCDKCKTEIPIIC